jgi:hypothetical protein
VLAHSTSAERVEARLYDVSGRLRARIPFERVAAGGSIALDAVDLSPGVVFLELRMPDGERSTHKVTVIR